MVNVTIYSSIHGSYGNQLTNQGNSSLVSIRSAPVAGGARTGGPPFGTAFGTAGTEGEAEGAPVLGRPRGKRGELGKCWGKHEKMLVIIYSGVIIVDYSGL